MFSIRKWIAAKMFAQLAAGQTSRRRLFLDNGGQSSRSFIENSSLHGNSLLKFYYADEELNMIAAELDSFDGRKDPVRCTALVNQLRSSQDKVISLLFLLMDEWNCERADRDYRQKFPDDLMAGGENGESLNGQIWFGAECLAAGSNIMNHESESEMLRPTAKTLTNSLDQLRMELRHACTDIDDSFFVCKDILSLDLTLKMEQFDRLFASFEYEYVKAMLPIKTAEEIEKLHELTVLFSEALSSALRRKVLSQGDLDECQPHVMIAIPRLAIIYGLTQCSESPIFRTRKEQLPVIFKPFHNLLHRIRDLILELRPVEVELLEKMLTNEQSSSITKEEPSLNGDVKDEQSSPAEEEAPRPSPPSHKRRHSAPDRINRLSTNLRTSNDIVRSASTASLMNIITAVNASQELESKSTARRDVLSSNASLDTTTSTVDSFEIALALGAKNSTFISAGTRQLLQRLFVTVAGVADQLQSNCASDLRMILRNVFIMYSDNEDDISVEEAFEAREDSSSSTSSASSSVTTPTGGENTTLQSSLDNVHLSSENVENVASSSGLINVTEPSLEEENGASSLSCEDVERSESPPPIRRRRRTRASDSQSSHNEASGVLIAPVWVPDELVSNCTGCTLSFNLIRRRHHCRNCGQIYCNQCSSRAIPLAHFGYERSVRVCEPCFSHYQDANCHQELASH